MKKFIKFAFVAAIVAVAGYNVYQSQSVMNGMSEFALANVEALAGGEWIDGGRINCMSFITSPRPDELEDITYPIVVDCEPCGNLVIAKSASGNSFCTYYAK